MHAPGLAARTRKQRAWTVAMGEGVALRTGVLLRGHAVRRCLLVTREDLQEHAGIVRGALAASGILVDSFAHDEPQPSITTAEQVVRWASGRGSEAVVGLGGDHELALAQAVALLLVHGGAPGDYAGRDRVPGSVLPIVAVPTIAGSMLDDACVLASTEPARIAIVDDRIAPTLRVVDSELQRDTPIERTRDAGLAALSLAIAAREHDASQSIASAFARLHARPRDRVACAELSWAALGVGVQRQTGHALLALAHAVDAHTGLGIGACMAAVLPAIFGRPIVDLRSISPLAIDESELDAIAELALQLDTALRSEPSTHARLRAVLSAATA